MLYLGAGNTLYYPNAAMTINAFRGYFQLKGITDGDVTNAQMFFGDDENTTAIQEHESHDCNATLSKRESHELSGAWYTLDGRRLGSTFNVPRNATLSPRERSTLKKGLYIVNGRKVVIK
jgi:hypothetical protein